MRKRVFLVSLVLVILLSITGCTQSGKPLGISLFVSDFSRKANIAIGDMSYDCLIDYLDGTVTVTALSSSASGLVFSYDGKELTFDYEDMNLSFESVSLDMVNPAVEIYNAIAAVNSESVTAVPVKDGIRAEGETQSGAFTALFDTDYNLTAIELKNANVYIKFKAPN